MLKKLQLLAYNTVKPLAKRLIVQAIKDNQVLVINTIKSKVDIPKLTPAEESVLYIQLYDALETAAVAIINKI